MPPTVETDPLISGLEHDLIGGRARWIADLSEFFRDYKVGDTSFDLFAKGRTRNRGLFLSRFFSWTALPDYAVALFCVDESAGGKLSLEKLRRKMDLVLRMMEEEDFHWSWLIIFSSPELPTPIVSFVSRYDRRELGLAIASTSTGHIVVSNNQIGRSIRKRMGLEKLLRKSSNAKTS